MTKSQEVYKYQHLPNGWPKPEGPPKGNWFPWCPWPPEKKPECATLTAGVGTEVKWSKVTGNVQCHRVSYYGNVQCHRVRYYGNVYRHEVKSQEMHNVIG